MTLEIAWKIVTIFRAIKIEIAKQIELCYNKSRQRVVSVNTFANGIRTSFWGKKVR